MRIYLYIIFFFFPVLQLMAQNSLQIEIRNIEVVKGELFLQLGTDTLMFTKKAVTEPIVARKIVTDSVMIFDFEDLSDGIYAFAVFQDLNDNGKLDTKKFGIPVEPFAFSNNALGKFGPPKFSEAGFDLKGGKKHVQEVKLLYRKPQKKKNAKE